MYGIFGEKKSMKRGSHFIQPVGVAFGQNPKKNVYSKPSHDEFPEFHVQRQTRNIDEIGDNISDFPHLEAKRSLSVVVKNGHFAKLKKNGYKKFVENKSKSLEFQHMEMKIEKIQLKIDQLCKAIELKAAIKAAHTSGPIASNECKIVSNPLHIKKALEGFGVSCFVIAVLMLGVYIVEGDRFHRSIFSSSFMS